MLFSRLIILSLVLSSFLYSAYASPSSYAEQHLTTFSSYIESSLKGDGLKDFKRISKDVRNNIQWSQGKHKNKYLDAYQRSYPFMEELARDDVPLMVLLIPYLESTWHGKKGKPTSDYGYWQMVPETINEIQQLDEASDELLSLDANTVREDPDLSTEAALIHINRYFFYFNKVAGFTENDSWLFAITSYNWGSGNIKNTLAEMKSKGKPVNFSSFYHYLYSMDKKKRTDRSARVALEYLPNLWNIAQLIQDKKTLAKK